MNNKTLGTCALIGAPAMFIGTLAEDAYPQLSDSWFTGVWGLLYITAFMCLCTADNAFGCKYFQFDLAVGRKRQTFFFYGY
jgi:hypothetical protein